MTAPLRLAAIALLASLTACSQPAAPSAEKQPEARPTAVAVAKPSPASQIKMVDSEGNELDEEAAAAVDEAMGRHEMEQQEAGEGPNGDWGEN